MKIIIIDDNPAIHQDFIKILTSANLEDEKSNDLEEKIFGKTEKGKTISLPEFEIETASQGQEGVDKIAQGLKEGKPFALAFVDIRMPPGWDGIETTKHIWELDPNIQVVICTAYSDYTWEETIEELGERDNLLILKKPFDNIAVRQLACALTKKWQLMQDAKEYTTSLEDRVRERTQSLNKSLSLMRATFESSAEGMLVIDKRGKITNYNQKFLDMWNIPQTLIDMSNFKSLSTFLADQLVDSKDFLNELSSLKDHSDATMMGNIKCKDNRTFEFYTQTYTMDNKNMGRVWAFRDITKRAALETELQYQATHDLLTGLPNRVLLLNQMKKSIKDAKNANKIFGILFLDLDRFKLINDSLNHQAGDEILQAVASRLKAILGDNTILARIGGDEFVILMNNIRNDEELASIASKLLLVFNLPFKIADHQLTLSTSIGICVYPRDGKNIDELLRNADTAMYKAKEQGSNQFQFYTDEMNKQNLERLQKESELRQAIANNEFFLTYQPQYDLANEKLVSVEALIRWQHPTKGLILPIDFIPLAEETGLIVPIGEWVLRNACQQVKEWHLKGLPKIRVAVNITTKQFRLFNLAHIIQEILYETGLEAKYLELELTENMIINNLDIITTIHDLKKIGVEIVLDDFGTGYSSLNYLREIPVDRLKIDQSYVQNIDSDRGDDVIIQAIIAMAKSLHLEVLAEGVETSNQLEFLKKNKCGEVQGFYFSKAVTAQECEKLLRNPTHVPLETLK